MDCPQPAALADLVDGHLSPGELVIIEGHLDACSRCAELVAVAGVSVSASGSTTSAILGHRSLVAAGTSFGRYQVRRWLGRGGMGDVYEGFDPQLERKVAIKVLRDGRRGTDSSSSRARLEREAKTLARLSHPHVVSALDIGIYDDQVFLVMELIEGPTLAAWLKAETRTWKQVLAAFLEAGEGLAAAHAVGVVHRDFKPQNVLMGADGKARVSDFGLARSFSSPADGGTHRVAPRASLDGQVTFATAAGALAGTPRYMAPEQFLGEVPDARVDQFSFCVALFESLYGQHPFISAPSGSVSDQRLESLKQAIIAGQVVAVPRRGIPRALGGLLARGLAVKPSDRFPSLRELLTRLDGVRRSRRRALILAGGVPLVGVLALAAMANFPSAASKSQVPEPIAPIGQPADWSAYPVVLRVNQRIYCVMPLGDSSARVIWGEPRRAEDLDLRTGARQLSNLVPESYRTGCPRLSPDGRQLLFEGYTDNQVAHIFHATNPQGRNAEPVVQAIDHAMASEPLWLPSGREFIFDFDEMHAAVFSLDTRRATVVSNLQQEPVEYPGFAKFLSPAGDRILITNLINRRGVIAGYIYRWPSLELEDKFLLSKLVSPLAWFGSSANSIWGRTMVGSVVALSAFNRRTKTSTLAGTVRDRDIYDYVALTPDSAGLVTKVAESSVWLRGSDGKEKRIRQHTVDAFSSPSIADSGDILLAQLGTEVSKIVAYRPSDGKTWDVSSGPDDYAVTALPREEFLVARNSPKQGVWRCSSLSPDTEQRCRLLVEASVQRMAASPDGKYLAFTSSLLQGTIIRLMTLDGGVVTDLNLGASKCQLIWSSPTRFWVSLRGGTKAVWTEYDAERRKQTGRTMPGTTTCDAMANWSVDLHAPVPSLVRIEIRDEWDLRVRPLR